MKTRRIWVQVSSTVAFQDWWASLSEKFPEVSSCLVEKWFGNELQWAPLIDSLFSFNLFGKKKVAVVLLSDVALKKEKDFKSLMDRLEKAAHSIVFQSEEAPPKEWRGDVWSFEGDSSEAGDDKAVFRWVDCLHSENLEASFMALESVKLSEKMHPLVCLQILSRHYRLGRLIHYARDKGFSDSEMSKVLKIPGIAIQKWKRKASKPNRYWIRVFQIMNRADLEMKSGLDGFEVLQKTSLDLQKLETAAKGGSAEEQRAIKPKRPSLFERGLSPIEPSFS